MNFWAIVGNNFLTEFKCQIDYKDNWLLIPYREPLAFSELKRASQAFCGTITEEETPREPYDMAYYSRIVPPEFGKMTKKDPLPPVPLDLTGTILTNDQQQQLKKLITQYRKVFAVTDKELGRTHLYQHRLRLKPDSEPPRPRLYRTNPHEREVIQKQIQEMLQNNIIKPADSPYSSPIVLVKKSDGTLTT